MDVCSCDRRLSPVFLTNLKRLTPLLGDIDGGMGVEGKLLISPSLYLRVRWDLSLIILLRVGGSRDCGLGIHAGLIGGADAGVLGAGGVGADVGELEH